MSKKEKIVLGSLAAQLMTPEKIEIIKGEFETLGWDVPTIEQMMSGEAKPTQAQKSYMNGIIAIPEEAWDQEKSDDPGAAVKALIKRIREDERPSAALGTRPSWTPKDPGQTRCGRCLERLEGGECPACGWGHPNRLV